MCNIHVQHVCICIFVCDTAWQPPYMVSCPTLAPCFPASPCSGRVVGLSTHMRHTHPPLPGGLLCASHMRSRYCTLYATELRVDNLNMFGACTAYSNHTIQGGAVGIRNTGSYIYICSSIAPPPLGMVMVCHPPPLWTCGACGLV